MKLMICIGMAVLLVFGANIGIVLLYSSPEKLSWNELGDSMALANTLFSGLAFVGFLVSLKLQRDELAETRKSVQTQTEELKRTADAHDAQVKHLLQQETFRQRGQIHDQYMFWVQQWEYLRSSAQAEIDVVIATFAEYRLECEMATRSNAEPPDIPNAQFPGPYYNFLGSAIGVLVSSGQEHYELSCQYARILRAQLSDGEKFILLQTLFDPVSEKRSLLARGVAKFEVLHGIGSKLDESMRGYWECYRGRYGGAVSS
jgi:hypothetical protein